jgi:hypothetical protein
MRTEAATGNESGKKNHGRPVHSWTSGNTTSRLASAANGQAARIASTVSMNSSGWPTSSVIKYSVP